MSAVVHRGSENGNRYSPTGREVLTRSGVLIDVTAPRPEQIVLTDIAVSLAEQKRFTGHCLLRPTVASHSVAVEWIGGMLFQQQAPVDPLDRLDDVYEAEMECRRECLMHDAPEFLVSDLNGAVKKDIRPPQWQVQLGMPNESRFDELESLAAEAIAARFGLTSNWGVIVHEADILACAYEMAWGGWCTDAHPPRWVADSLGVQDAYRPLRLDGGESAFLARAEFLGLR